MLICLLFNVWYPNKRNYLVMTFDITMFVTNNFEKSIGMVESNQNILLNQGSPSYQLL